MALITELLTSASPLKRLYLVRTINWRFENWDTNSTIREAMAKAFFKNEEEEAERIQEAIDKSNDLAVVFEIVKKGKINDLGKVKIELGKPMKVMLAEKVKTIKEGFEAVGKPAAIEYKYDGFRLYNT